MRPCVYTTNAWADTLYLLSVFYNAVRHIVSQKELPEQRTCGRLFDVCQIKAGCWVAKQGDKITEHPACGLLLGGGPSGSRDTTSTRLDDLVTVSVALPGRGARVGLVAPRIC